MGSATNQEPGLPPARKVPLTGEPLPLDLVNTTYIKGGLRGHLVDALTTPADLDAWLTAHRAGFGPALAQAFDDSRRANAGHVEAFVRLRHALRELAAARTSERTPGPEHVAAVNAAARLSARWQELVAGPTSLAAAPRWLESDPRLVALGEVATEAVRLFSGEQAPLIRACPAPGCILYFVKNHARRAWCTTGCGNRVRVARHNRRSREGEPPPDDAG